MTELISTGEYRPDEAFDARRANRRPGPGENGRKPPWLNFPVNATGGIGLQDIN